VIAAGAALGLTAKLLDVRGGWMQEAEKLKKSNAEGLVRLEAARKELDLVKADLSRELLRWDRYWNDVPASYVNRGDDSALSADVGTSQGLGSTEGNVQPVVYAFQLGEDGTPVYVGPFQAIQLRENQAALRPAFRVREGEAETWTARTWRFRASVPDAVKSRFLDLESQLLVADERLRKEDANLALQTQLVDAAKQHRDFRMAELLGGEDGSKGLIAEIEEQEDARNAALAEVDRWRRDVNAAVHRLQELSARNKELARRLASQRGPESSETAQAGGN